MVDGLDEGAVMLGSTHNHSAPHYVSTAIGHWIFADTLDVRAFERTARRADTARQPARVAAASMPFRGVQHNIIGRSTADDGSPRGFPRDYVDDELAVIRIDDHAGAAIAAIVINFGMHPESVVSGADLISSDFVGIVERDLGRAAGCVRENRPGGGLEPGWTGQSGTGTVTRNTGRCWQRVLPPRLRANGNHGPASGARRRTAAVA